MTLPKRLKWLPIIALFVAALLFFPQKVDAQYGSTGGVQTYGSTGSMTVFNVAPRMGLLSRIRANCQARRMERELRWQSRMNAVSNLYNCNAMMMVPNQTYTPTYYQYGSQFQMVPMGSQVFQTTTVCPCECENCICNKASTVSKILPQNIYTPASQFQWVNPNVTPVNCVNGICSPFGVLLDDNEKQSLVLKEFDKVEWL